MKLIIARENSESAKNHVERLVKEGKIVDYVGERMFFLDVDGYYEFYEEGLPDARRVCLGEVGNQLDLGNSVAALVYSDNYEDYVKLGKACGAEVEIFEG